MRTPNDSSATLPRMGPHDTDPESLRVQIEVMRGISGPEKLRFASDLTVFAHALTLAGIRARMPEATPEQVEEEHYRLVLGRELADKVLAYRRQLGGEATSGS